MLRSLNLELWRRIVLVGLVLALSIWLLRLTDPIGPPGKDLYQVWLGARTLLHGGDPYGPEVRAEMHRAYGWWGQHGLPYPLPALWLHLPLALLPLTPATWLWKALCLATILLFAVWRGAGWWQALVPLLFLPLVRAFQLYQPSLTWLALACVTIITMERRWRAPAGLGLALLPAKPQVGLIIAVLGLLWAWRHDRRLWWWGVGCSALIWGGSLLLFPDWWREWLVAVRAYRSAYGHLMAGALPWALLLLLPALRLPWWGWDATAQAVLFPAHDTYVLAPLLLAWLALGGAPALIGVLCSWSGIFVLNGPALLWGAYFVPYLILMSWAGMRRSFLDRWPGWRDRLRRRGTVLSREADA
ncbi:hypothetical protein [Kallotenue papyrolyticum]|uniref:hypothetical protein n=1 Tax=Kallotenue papyrolyticum TaxID=1325125 RepID=UPI0004786791|nr:hypothetical protein [Kallotenue papyrolyticum]